MDPVLSCAGRLAELLPSVRTPGAPAWLTVNVVFPMAIDPVRERDDGFAVTAQPTVRLPAPDAPIVMVIQDVVERAVHG
jgi:hypothetical protein